MFSSQWMQMESTEYVGVTWRLTLIFWMGSVCRTNLGRMEEVNGRQIDGMRPWKCHSIYTNMLLSASIITVVNNTRTHTHVFKLKKVMTFLCSFFCSVWCLVCLSVSYKHRRSNSAIIKKYRKVLRLLVMINKCYPSKCYMVNSVANPFKSLNIKINNDSFKRKPCLYVNRKSTSDRTLITHVLL